MTTYEDFVSTKLTRVPPTGLAEVPALHPSLFAFQADLVAWALRRGRAALFADTGLGKTAMQLEWARHVPGDVLILAPLAVAAQTAREGARIGLPVHVCRDGADVKPGVNVTNYERLHRFDVSRFKGVVLDESSIIKHHDAKTLRVLLDAFAATPFRLCATATPSPNDYTELGTHAEFLGICTRTEMLAEYFCHDGGETQVWRLKGHGRAMFWKWVAGWGAMLRKPGDLGYPNEGYDLPALNVHQHTLAADAETVRNAGLLFAAEAGSLTERRTARRASLAERIRAAAQLVMQECTCGHRKNNGRTTANTTDETSTSGRPGPANSKTSTTPSDAQSTRATSPSERRRSGKSRNGSSATLKSDSGSASENTDSLQSSTTPCSRNKGGAPSAERRSRRTSPENGCTSTTTTSADESAAYSAANATEGSGTSATTTNCSNARPHTCTCPASERWVVWCELNAEQEALAEAFGDECFSVHGTLDSDEKERRLTAFVNGERRILLTKPSIAGWGINLQSVARMAFVGVTDSYEAFYQAVRRCWRFGQTRDVEVHVYASEVEGSVLRNLQRKERDAQAMAEQLAVETRDAVRAEVRGQSRQTNDYAPRVVMTVPEWINSDEEAA